MYSIFANSLGPLLEDQIDIQSSMQPNKLLKKVLQELNTIYFYSSYHQQTNLLKGINIFGAFVLISSQSHYSLILTPGVQIPSPA